MKEHAILPEIEIFDLSHLYGMRRLMDAGLISDRPHVQFVMGIRNASPVEEYLLDLLLSVLKRLAPKATWTAAGIGRHQNDMAEWVLRNWSAWPSTSARAMAPVPRRPRRHVRSWDCRPAEATFISACANRRPGILRSYSRFIYW